MFSLGENWPRLCFSYPDLHIGGIWGRYDFDGINEKPQRSFLNPSHLLWSEIPRRKRKILYLSLLIVLSFFLSFFFGSKQWSHLYRDFQFKQTQGDSIFELRCKVFFCCKAFEVLFRLFEALTVRSCRARSGCYFFSFEPAWVVLNKPILPWVFQDLGSFKYCPYLALTPLLGPSLSNPSSCPCKTHTLKASKWVSPSFLITTKHCDQAW